MQAQLPGSKKIKKLIYRIMLLFSGSIILFLVSCKNDIDTINAFAVGPDRPTVTYTNVAFEYSDSAKLQARLNTKLVNYFLEKEEPYYEFPEGIEVLFYDEEQNLQSVITSKYATFLVDKELFEVRDSVVAKNTQEHQTLETEQMFWNRKKQIIYSEVFTKITDEDGVHFGQNGFEASQDFSKFRLIGSKGKLKVKDEERP